MANLSNPHVETHSNMHGVVRVQKQAEMASSREKTMALEGRLEKGKLQNEFIKAIRLQLLL